MLNVWTKLLITLCLQVLLRVVDFHAGKGDLNKDFENAKHVFIDYWEQIAKRYKNYPNTLMFELINEPTFAFNKLKANRSNHLI